jgi:hypothetical protein
MPQVKHAVLLRFKPDLPPQKALELLAEVGGLQDKIPGILDFSGGAYSSPEGMNKGYTHGFVMTFADEASRDAYLPHPEHEVVKAKILEALDGGVDGVVAVDWLVE